MTHATADLRLSSCSVLCWLYYCWINEPRIWHTITHQQLLTVCFHCFLFFCYLGEALVLSFVSPAVSVCAHICWLGTQTAACLCLGWGLLCRVFTEAQWNHWSFASEERKVWENSPEQLTCRWIRGLGVWQKKWPCLASPQKLVFQKIFLGWREWKN